MLPQKVIDRFHRGLRVGRDDECWPFEGGSYNKRGWHRLIAFSNGATKKNYPAHRVAYELANGEITGGQFVLHKCDNPVCCNPRHLFLGTQSDNAKDMWVKGRGNVNNHNKLGRVLGPSPFRKVNVELAVAMYLTGYTQRAIAKAMGCSDVAVGNFLKKDPRTAPLLGRGGAAVSRRWENKASAATALIAQGLTQREVAQQLGVSQAWISKISRRA